MINVNDISVVGIIPNNEIPINTRAKLDTGTFCNYDCEFCYYRDELDIRTDLDIIKERADHLVQSGMTEVDLSGGESSIEPNWFKILEYCNTRFKHISCLSHGGKFANIEFLKKSYDYGLREVLFSLHGFDEETHDSITNRKGSFKKILLAIKNAHELGMVVRINTTVYNKNYNKLDSELLNSLNPLEVNFITLNYWDDAKGEVGDLKDVTNAIKACINELDVKYINVRYTPYCYMKGYERHVCNQYQHVYDTYDWNKGVYNKEDGSNIEKSFRAAEVDRLKYYKKPHQCMKCSHFYICDGIENELDIRVYPIEGDKIKDVIHYRKDFYEI